MKARIFSSLTPVGRGNRSSDLEDVLIFSPGDLEFIPLSDLHLVAGPRIQSDMLRERRGPAHAYHRRSDQFVSIRPFFDARPILDPFPMAAELKGVAHESSTSGARHLRRAQLMSSGEDQTSSGGSTERRKKLIEAAGAPTEIRKETLAVREEIPAHGPGRETEHSERPSP